MDNFQELANFEKIADKRSGRSEHPVLRESLQSFSRKGMFSECHARISNKILEEVARLCESAGCSVGLQDEVEVVAKTPAGCVVTVRREGDSYHATNRSVNGESVYWDAPINSFDEVSDVLRAGR